jgi:hypothetical protein
MKFQCFECGGKAEYSHHVVPRSFGGTRTVPLCGECHAKVHHVDGERRLSGSVLTRRALARKKARGQRVGTIPYGFKLGHDGVHLVPCPAERTVLAIIRDMRANGRTLVNIADELNSRGLTRREGGKWDHGFVSRLLRRAT